MQAIDTVVKLMVAISDDIITHLIHDLNDHFTARKSSVITTLNKITQIYQQYILVFCSGIIDHSLQRRIGQIVIQTAVDITRKEDVDIVFEFFLTAVQTYAH